MKNRKNVLIVFAVLAILCLGIGYAALTDSLQLTGTIKGGASDADIVNPEEFNILWVSGTTEDSSNVALDRGGKALTSAANADDAEGTATLTISNMFVAGDKVVATYVFENEELSDDPELQYDANINIAFTGYAQQDGPVINWEVKIGGNVVTDTIVDNQGLDFVLENGAQATLVVTVQLLDTLISGDYTWEISFDITAEAK